MVLSQLVPAEDLLSAVQGLQQDGLAEDGYSGIIYALDNIDFRDGTAKQVILITDERRVTIRTDLNRDIVEERLRNGSFILNAVIDQGFLSMFNQSGLGLDSSGNIFLIDDSGPDLYIKQPGGRVDRDFFASFNGTYEDYVVLAHSVGGVAWDLNQLRLSGRFAEAFSNAFTDVKVMEVVAGMFECFCCLCASSITGRCSRVSGVAVQDCVGPCVGEWGLGLMSSIYHSHPTYFFVLSLQR